MGKSKAVSKYDELMEAAAGLSSLWLEFRKYFRKALMGADVSMDEEQRFLQVKSDLARLQRILAQNIPEGVRYGSHRITETMGQSISVSTIRDLPPPDKKQLYAKWHAAYIALQNLIGIVGLLCEGHSVQFQSIKTRSGNVKESLGITKRKKKKSAGKIALYTAVAIAVVAGALWYMSNQ